MVIKWYNNVYRVAQNYRTIQPFNRVNKNLHKVMPLTLVAHRRIIMKTKMKCVFKYSVVINILCDVIADVVDVNMKVCPLTSEDRALIRALQVENRWEAPLNSPDLNPVDYSIWGALQQLGYSHRRIQDIEHLKEVLQTCWEQIG